MHRAINTTILGQFILRNTPPTDDLYCNTVEAIVTNTMAPQTAQNRKQLRIGVVLFGNCVRVEIV